MQHNPSPQDSPEQEKPTGRRRRRVLIGCGVLATGALALLGGGAYLLENAYNDGVKRIAGAMKGKVVVDLRNVYRPDDMRRAGFDYHSIGRPEAR